MTSYTGQLYPATSPSSLGGMDTLSYTTAAIESGSTIEFSIPSVKTYQILSITTSSPCWLRVYGTSYGRAIDTRAQPGAPFPPSGSGFFTEVQSTPTNLTTFLAPVVTVQVETTDTLFSIRNDSGVTLPITLTLSVIPLSYDLPQTQPPYGCNPYVNTQWQTDLSQSWKDCISVTRLPLLDLSSTENLSQAWSGCLNLSYVPAGLFDDCPATDLSYAFVNCSLTSDSVDNILISLDTAGLSNGTVDITGWKNSTPSLTGLSALSNLEGKGWTVNVVTGGPVSVFPDIGGVIYSLTSFGDGRVFAGDYDGYVYKSEDYGVSFDEGVYITYDAIRSLTACEGSTIIAGSWGETYPFISTDNGATWSNGRDFGDSEIDSVAYAGNGVVYVGTYNYLHKSMTNGANWFPKVEPKTGGNSYYRAICFPGPGKIVAATYNNGYFVYSQDGGETWDYTPDYVLDGLNEPIYGLASNGNGVVLAGTTGDGRIFKSIDSGVTWDVGTQLGSASEVYTIYCSDTGIFYAGTNDDGKIYRSVDAGGSWELFFDPETPGSYVYSLTGGGNSTLIAGIDNLVYSIPYSLVPSITPPEPPQQYPNTSSYVQSLPYVVSGSTMVSNIISLTQAEYDNIVSPDSATLYVIVG